MKFLSLGILIIMTNFSYASSIECSLRGVNVSKELTDSNYDYESRGIEPALIITFDLETLSKDTMLMSESYKGYTNKYEVYFDQRMADTFIVPVVHMINNKFIKIVEADEVEKDIYLLDLEKMKLTHKYQKSFFFGGTTYTKKKFNYECRYL